MRTTVDIHEALLERAKALALASGVRLTDVVNDALREMLSRMDQQRRGSSPEPMPISEVRGRGLSPGLDLADTSELIDALDGFGAAEPPRPDGLR